MISALIQGELVSEPQARTASEVLTVYEATKRRKPGAGSEGDA